MLLRLDETRLDFTGIEDQVPPDRDMPVAWSKTYGKGRVFASSIGHTRESFADPDVARMYSEAIKWALGLTDGGLGPHGRPAPTDHERVETSRRGGRNKPAERSRSGGTR